MNTLIVVFFLSHFIYSIFNNCLFLVFYLVAVGTYYYVTQIRFFKTPYNSIRNKTTIATWSSQTDPLTYIKLKIDITRMEKYLEKISSETGEKITLTIFIIKLMSIVLKKFPEINGYINLGKVFIT